MAQSDANLVVLDGFPHPSGGNGHRVRLFQEGKQRMAEAVARAESIMA